MSDQPTPTPEATTLPTVHQALSAVMAEVREVGKYGYNQSQNFAFRGVEDVVNAVAPALRHHGVICIPRLVERTQASKQSAKGGNLNYVNVIVEYTFFGPQGDSLVGSVAAESMDSGDKATAKAMSVAYRTWWIQALCLPTQDTDPDMDSYETAAPVSGPVDTRPVNWLRPANAPTTTEGWGDQFKAAASLGPVEFVKFIDYAYSEEGTPDAVFPALPTTLTKLNQQAEQYGQPTATYNFPRRDAQ